MDNIQVRQELRVYTRMPEIDGEWFVEQKLFYNQRPPVTTVQGPLGDVAKALHVMGELKKSFDDRLNPLIVAYENYIAIIGKDYHGG